MFHIFIIIILIIIMLADISHPDELHFPMINSPHLFILIFLSITQFLLRMPGAWLIANNTVWTNEWVNNSSFNLFLNAKLFSVYCICLGNQHLSASQCVFLPSFSSSPFPCLPTYIFLDNKNIFSSRPSSKALNH